MAKQGRTAPNRVQESRVREGIPRTRLAELADLSTKTIKRIENGDSSVSPESKHSVVKAFNAIENKLLEYTFEYLFPDSS